MAGVAKQAAILSVARLANYGLLLISPILLVRLLSIEEFGRYREFLVYASLLVSYAGFSIVDSLLTFIPKHPGSETRVVLQTAKLVAFSSLAVVGVACSVDVVVGGGLLGGFRWPLALYVLLFVNLDFWESYWLALHRSSIVFVYSSARLIARMLVVVGAAAVTADVGTIVWCLIALEAVRLTGAALVLRRMARAPSPPLEQGFAAEQWRFCLPWGMAVVLGMTSRNLGNLAVVKLLGVASLAHYAIGLYAEPIITALRNSLSTVLLPEMVRRSAAGGATEVWQRATGINCLLLFPAATFGCLFAESIIVTVFGTEYRAAAPVMQVFMAFLVRECFDLTLPFRALGRSTPFVRSGLIGFAVNGALLLVLVPALGIVGGAIALVCASFTELAVLMRVAMRSLSLTLRDLIPFADVARIAAASAAGGAAASLLAWHRDVGLVWLVVLAATMGLVYLGALLALRVGALQDLLRFLPGRAAR